MAGHRPPHFHHLLMFPSLVVCIFYLFFTLNLPVHAIKVKPTHKPHPTEIPPSQPTPTSTPIPNSTPTPSPSPTAPAPSLTPIATPSDASPTPVSGDLDLDGDLDYLDFLVSHLLFDQPGASDFNHNGTTDIYDYNYFFSTRAY